VTTTFDIEEIERARIVTGRNNRTVFKPATITILAADIQENGLIQPPTCDRAPMGDFNSLRASGGSARSTSF